MCHYKWQKVFSAWSYDEIAYSHPKFDRGTTRGIRASHAIYHVNMTSGVTYLTEMDLISSLRSPYSLPYTTENSYRASLLLLAIPISPANPIASTTMSLSVTPVGDPEGTEFSYCRLNYENDEHPQLVSKIEVWMSKPEDAKGDPRVVGLRISYHGG
ncbi:uncharacterized protein BDV17DRAFT_67828 [Aspergillus undulatus]|uniref:uncharacterized protein n=1 Tax=Aspergillus undulatus TaxID=1810928 RepID=UPI003CCD4AD6